MRMLEYAIRDGELRAGKPNGFRLVRIRRDWLDEWICGGGGQVLLLMTLAWVAVASLLGFAIACMCGHDVANPICHLMHDLGLKPHQRG